MLHPAAPELQLWHAYLSERLPAVRGLPPKHPALQALANTFERSLVTMHTRPRTWLMYLQLRLLALWCVRVWGGGACGGVCGCVWMVLGFALAEKLGLCCDRDCWQSCQKFAQRACNE